jgi:hypothetical protein
MGILEIRVHLQWLEIAFIVESLKMEKSSDEAKYKQAIERLYA